MDSAGYVITRPYPESNVGSNLASLAGALWLARRLSRTLVVDWRGLAQLRDPSLNYFTEFFAAHAELQGVPVLYAPVDGLDYDPADDGSAWLSPDEARGLAAGGRQAEPAQPIVLQPYHGLDRLQPYPETERFRLLRGFYRELRPAPAIEQAIERWMSEWLEDRFVIGVNVRTGNGRYFGKGTQYAGRVDISVFDNRRRFLRVLERACRDRLRGLPPGLRDGFRIFYATDSSEMAALLAQLPNAVTRRSVFPPPGTGDTHRFEDAVGVDRRSVEDTVADLFLLGRCDALVYNSSFFNQYARIVTGYFGGNHVHLESLFLRHRAAQLARGARRRLPL